MAGSGPPAVLAGFRYLTLYAALRWFDLRAKDRLRRSNALQAKAVVAKGEKLPTYHPTAIVELPDTFAPEQDQMVESSVARARPAGRVSRSSQLDLMAETLITLADATRLLPRKTNGRRVHLKTIARWCICGIQGIKLESLKLGRNRYTSKEACQRFAESLTGGGLVARSTVDRSRADEEAERRLKAEGF